MSLESNVGNLAIKRETISKISSPPSSFGKWSLRRPWNWTFGLCIVVRVDGGVQQGAGVCGSVLFNVGNLAIKSETVFQNSFPPSSFGKWSPEGLGIGHLVYAYWILVVLPHPCSYLEVSTNLFCIEVACF